MRMLPFLAFIVLICVSDGVLARIRTSAPDCASKGCSHKCETVGEFPLCVCPPDMTLKDDEKTCKDNASFLLAMFRGVKLYSAESEEETTVAPVEVRCLDYHYGRKELYAFVSSSSSIMRYSLTKGKKASPVSLVTPSDTMITSLAVDWVNDVIYYVSKQQSVVGAVSPDGTNKRAVLYHNGSEALPDLPWRNLVVDPYAKRLFWLGNTTLYSSNLEGGDLVTDLASWILPDGIALDIENQLIYVIGRSRGDATDNKSISRVSYKGTKVGEDVEISHPATSTISGFGVVRKRAYWESNHDGENLYRCDLENGEKGRIGAVALVAELNQIVYDMKLYHPDVQKSPKEGKD